MSRRAGRHQARVLAMQALCQWEAQGAEFESHLDSFLAEFADLAETSQAAGELARRSWQQRDESDRLISERLRDWDLDRLVMVERNILRLAVAELLEGRTPPKVVLDEAVTISREFGGAESPKLVNGVLDAIFKQQQRQENNEATTA